jgi:hypothetical protein
VIAVYLVLMPWNLLAKANFGAFFGGDDVVIVLFLLFYRGELVLVLLTVRTLDHFDLPNGTKL